jgi:hypothetical protein
MPLYPFYCTGGTTAEPQGYIFYTENNMFEVRPGNKLQFENDQIQLFREACPFLDVHTMCNGIADTPRNKELLAIKAEREEKLWNQLKSNIDAFEKENDCRLICRTLDDYVSDVNLSISSNLNYELQMNTTTNDVLYVMTFDQLKEYACFLGKHKSQPLIELDIDNPEVFDETASLLASNSIKTTRKSKLVVSGGVGIRGWFST